MRATRYHGTRDVRVDTVPEPTIMKGTDALVRVTKAGICGSDLHFFNNGADLGMVEGTRLGHEFVGVVEAVGDGVRTLSVGDRVVAAVYRRARHWLTASDADVKEDMMPSPVCLTSLPP